MNTTDRAQVITTGPDEVFGQSWATRKGLDSPPGGPALALRPPCPVCGHPTSDCISEGAHRG